MMRHGTLPLNYQFCREFLAKMADKDGWFHVTSDGWTSMLYLRWCCVTFHFMNKRFEMVSFMITAEWVEGRHGSDDIGRWIEQEVDAFLGPNSSARLLSITQDGAPNARGAGRQLCGADFSQWYVDKQQQPLVCTMGYAR